LTAWPDPPANGRFFACNLRDDLLHNVEGLDPATRRLLRLALPPDLPPSACRFARDETIRSLADKLRAAIPGISTRALAEMIAAAGRWIEGGGQTLDMPLGCLDDAERVAVAAEIRRALSWMPPRPQGSRWPSWRRITDIIAA
jgi:hypothetical protein